MTRFSWNLLLALAWAAMGGDFSAFNLFVGFVWGYLILFFSQPITGSSRYFAKLWQLIGFIGFFIRELIKSNLRVIYDVLTPTHHMQPGVIALPLEAGSDAEITLLANLISLTPGTLSLDVSTDKRVLYIHAMYIDDQDALLGELKYFEQRVLELVR